MEYRKSILCSTIFLISLLIFLPPKEGFSLNHDPWVDDPLRVPLDYPTIQEAIDASLDGFTVLVAPGIYTGEGNRDIDFLGKAISVLSESGPEMTVIDCEGSEEDPHRGFNFHTAEGPSAALAGFTITNGYVKYEGGGIYCHYSSPTITNCIIEGNAVRGLTSCGGGICCDSYSDPIITGCIITGNMVAGRWASGGGIYTFYSAPIIRKCVISDNAADSGGGVYCCVGEPIIRNCTVTGNTAVMSGGGIFSENACLSIANCTMSENIALNEGGGLYCIDWAPTVVNSILWNVSPDEISGAAVVSYSDVEGGWPGEGNIDADPLFIGESDFHLFVGSPCMDTGKNIEVYKSGLFYSF